MSDDLNVSIHRDLLAAYVNDMLELAALKARRCDGCQWWQYTETRAGLEPPGANGRVGTCGTLGAYGIHADFACNAWMARP